MSLSEIKKKIQKCSEPENPGVKMLKNGQIIELFVHEDVVDILLPTYEDPKNCFIDQKSDNSQEPIRECRVDLN